MLTTAVVGGGVATAAPGNPGVPQAPVTVFTEDFQNVPSTAPVLLTGYTGITGQTYTAAAPWLTGCNGSVLQFNSANAAQGSSSCATSSSYDRVRQLAHALGQHVGSANPAQNSAVTAYTEGNPGANLVQFETVDPIALSASNRFITFSVDAAAQNCFATPPQFGFYLLDGDTAIPTFTTPINPCADAGGIGYTAPAIGGASADTGIRAGTYAGNNGYLFSGSEIGIRMVNLNGSGSGNDAAFDNIRILDVTPQLDKSFSVGSQTEGLPVTLTFTVTNTSELGQKAGWSFTDNLPTGMTVADPNAVASTCANGDITAVAGSDTIVVDGDLAVGQVSCTVSVNVTAGPGTYVNGPENMEGFGLNPPGTSTVTFDALSPSLDLVKNAALVPAGNGVAEVGETVAYTFDVTNTGNVAIDPVAVSDPKAGAVTCPVGPLAAGATVTCVADAPYIVIQADVDAGILFNEATATGTPVPPPGYEPIAPVSSAPADSELPVPAAAPSLEIGKSAVLNDTNDNGTAEVGETIDYIFLVQNTGNVTLTEISVTDPKAGAVTCPAGPLPPNAITECSADEPYVVTQADVDGGIVENTATASGLPPVLDPANPPAPVVSEPDTTETEVPAAAPALELEKVGLLDDVNDNGTADLGEAVGYLFAVTNIGNVTLTGITVDDPKAGTVICDPAPIGPGFTVFCAADELYIVTQEDVDAGEVLNIATASGLPPVNDPENPPAPVTSEPAVFTGPTTFAPAVSVEKTGTLNDEGDDDNGNGTADLGETVDYTFVVTNTGNVTLTGLSVDDPKAGAVTCPDVALAPGESVTCTADAPYVVTQADVDGGVVENTATASGLPPVNDPENPPVEVVSAPSVDVIEATYTPALEVLKDGVLDDVNGNAVADVDETIAYTFTVVNTGNVTLTELVVLDAKVGPVTCPEIALAPGESAVCAADLAYVVTQADVDAGVVLNAATAAATTPVRADGTPGEQIVSLEVLNEIPVPAAAPELDLVKLAELNDTNGNGTADVGETISYGFAVANLGNVTLTDVAIDDPKIGAVTCAWTVLAPGEITVCIGDADYVVTQADVTAGTVENVATASALAPGSDTLVVSGQAVVNTPVTPVVPAPAPAPAPHPPLAATGVPAQVLVPAALALLLLGGLALVVSRRRETGSISG